MNYKVLSPWAKVDPSDMSGLTPRLADLNGKVIGLLSHFKEHAPVMLLELERQLKQKFPDAKFSHLQYPKDTIEIINDPEFEPRFKEWVNSVDTVISAYGDAGSCAMFLAYNTAYIEKLGKPAIMLVKEDLARPAQRGASARNVPSLRLIKMTMPDLSMLPVIDINTVSTIMKPALEPVLTEVVKALTAPLTSAEKVRSESPKDFSSITYEGTIDDINTAFYKNGWTNGVPIIPPTEQAVNEMLTGTDLPRDHVVGRIPPMLGLATVEKIAVNAVMAGCLPTYMPILISAVTGMLNPRIHLEGWTCSVSSWAPLITINGPIRNDISMNSGGAVLSPYYKPNSTIPRAIAYMILNIGGVRPVLEDMSEMGHESRFGICIAENEETSPWQPLQTDYGFSRDDSTITMFWPQTHLTIGGNNAQTLLRSMCNVDVFGWDPGCAFILSPGAAKALSKDGWDKKSVVRHLIEYNRKSAAEVPMRWIRGNNHLPKDVLLPADSSYSVRRFWSDDHVFIAVGGSNYAASGTAFGGGGDHGGPSCTEITLPKNWTSLVAKYKDIVPSYVNY